MKKYILHYTPRSPFARRIRHALYRLKLPFELNEQNVFQPSAEFLALNPLGMVPVLETLEGETWVDSNTILEALHDRHGGIWPASTEEKIHTRHVSTLATGVMTQVVSHFLESLKPSPSQPWMKDCETAIEDTLIHMNERSSLAQVWDGGTATQATWDLAMAIQYMSLRIHHYDWQERFPKLKALEDRLMKDSEFAASVPPPAAPKK